MGEFNEKKDHSVEDPEENIRDYSDALSGVEKEHHGRLSMMSLPLGETSSHMVSARSIPRGLQPIRNTNIKNYRCLSKCYYTHTEICA